MERRRRRAGLPRRPALARKLIVLVWYMLQNGEPYRYAPVESTRRKLRSLVPKQERTRVLRALSRRSIGKQAYRCPLRLPKQNAGLPRTTDEPAPDLRAFKPRSDRDLTMDTVTCRSP